MEADQEILLIEDNEDHAMMACRAIEDGAAGPPIRWVADGQQALEYLFKRGQYQKAARPGLILLDLNLPKVNGLDVLRAIRESELLKTIPVVVLTTSDRDEDATEAYSRGANSFVRKPAHFEEYFEKLRSVRLYWLTVDRGPLQKH